MTAIYDGTRSVQELVRDGAYDTKLPYPSKPKEPEVLRARAKELSDAELLTIPKVRAAYEAEKVAYEAGKEAYRQDSGRLASQFQTDLETEYGMTGHPKAGKLYHMAYEHGHSAGFSEIVNYYMDFVELVKD